MAIKGNLCRQLLQFKNVDAVRVFHQGKSPFIPVLVSRTASTRGSYRKHHGRHKSGVSRVLRGWKPDPVEGPSVRRKGKDSRKGSPVGGPRESEKWPSMYYSVRTSFQKRLIRRETINVRGGRVNEGRESAPDSSPDSSSSRVPDFEAGDSESLNRTTSV